MESDFSQQSVEQQDANLLESQGFPLEKPFVVVTSVARLTMDKGDTKEPLRVKKDGNEWLAIMALDNTCQSRRSQSDFFGNSSLLDSYNRHYGLHDELSRLYNTTDFISGTPISVASSCFESITPFNFNFVGHADDDIFGVDFKLVNCFLNMFSSGTEFNFNRFTKNQGLPVLVALEDKQGVNENLRRVFCHPTITENDFKFVFEEESKLNTVIEEMKQDISAEQERLCQKFSKKMLSRNVSLIQSKLMLWKRSYLTPLLSMPQKFCNLFMVTEIVQPK